MSETPKPEPGSITWYDLTVPDAENVRQFYEAVVGWKAEPVDMGGYNDFNMMTPSSGRTMAGVCHARGANATLPSQWLIYVSVANLDESIRQCVAKGGKVVAPERDMGEMGRFCVIQDPAGAVCALFEHAARGG
ncbi:MAG TPA: glyoxalase [Verrucomicrobiales bacterium]|nr:glyoxalase [Verrucomicrobiales bacterium]